MEPTYKIRIEKIVPNPNLESDLKRAEDLGMRMGARPRYEYETMPPIREEIVKDVLVVELTEAQYKAIKKEVIKVFE